MSERRFAVGGPVESPRVGDDSSPVQLDNSYAITRAEVDAIGQSDALKRLNDAYDAVPPDWQGRIGTEREERD